jgi:ribosomal protein S18 acetylase RimI-like enzyme
MSGLVATLSGDELLLPRLLEDPPWTAYALCDLDPPYRENARFIGFIDESGLNSVVLLYALPGSHALLAFGDPAGVGIILAHTPDLPEAAFLLVQDEYLSAVSIRYYVGTTWRMLRMSLDASVPRTITDSPIPLRRLGETDIAAVKELYAEHWGSTFFDPLMLLMLLSGVYIGAFQGSNLVAVSGTHVVSADRGIAAIGGVFTHPDFRGRGLATATTGAVCEIVRSMGANLIVLNVKEDNAPAISAYRRLGFEIYLPYIEGNATLR